MNSSTPLNVEEQEIISYMLINLINSCPYLPVNKIEYQFLPKDMPGIALFEIQGAIKSKEYIDGSYIGQYPFALVYRTKPTNSNQRIVKQNTIDSIGEWLEQLDYSELTNIKDRSIISINRTTTSSLVYCDESGNEDYQGLFNLKYFKEA